MLGPQLVVLLEGGVHLGRKKQRCDFQGDSLFCPVCVHICSLSPPLSSPCCRSSSPPLCFALCLSGSVCFSSFPSLHEVMHLKSQQQLKRRQHEV